MVVQEFLRMVSQKMYYFLKWWNCFTTVMLFIYLFSGVLWLLGFLIVNKDKTGYMLLLVGNSGFSIASIFLGLFLGFTVGVRNLYSYNRSLQHEIRRQELNNTDNDFVLTDHRLGT